MVQHVHRYSVDHRYFPEVIFEDKNHVEVFKMELYSLEVHELDVFKGDH